MAKVDILLTYWGDFELLKIAVESVMRQTDPDWHLYIFDDCYPSSEPAKYFAKITDKRVTYHRHQKNLGITHNFNYAVNAAKSEYCVLLGCDDIMLPSYLETALRNIGNAAFYQPNVQVIDADGVVYMPLADRIKAALRFKKAGTYMGERLVASIAMGNWLYFPSIMWRTKIIKKYGFNPDYKIAEDLFLIFSLIADGASMQLDNSVTFQYRRFAKSLSSKEKKRGGIRFNEEDDVYSKFAERFKLLGWKKAALASRVRLTSRLHRLIS